MRLEGWEVRLAEVIEAARSEPFRWGERDCFHLACAAVEALTGADRWPEFGGRYRSQRQALRIIGEHGPSFAEFVTWFFAVPPVGVNLARRGDLMMIEPPSGMSALGVCVGSEAAVRFERELGFLPRGRFACSWRIG